MDLTDDIIDWANSILIKAKVNDPTKDFCDGTVFMELIVLLMSDNETAVCGALEKFHENPSTMAHSLKNLRAVLKCLTEDKTDVDVNPLDLYRGKKQAVCQLLRALQDKYSDKSASNIEISGEDVKTIAENDQLNSIIDVEESEGDVMSSSTGLPELEDQLAVLNINESIIILIKDGDPLCVNRQRLTKASPVFKRLIEELSFYEIEMDDFEADTVGVFLTILEEEKAEDFEKDQFREIHKMSVCFEVLWLQISCRSWLSGKITEDMSNEEKLYVFEECLFILRKWEETDLMDLLIAKIMPDDNTEFIIEYLKDVKKVDSIQIELMFRLGKNDIKLFLQIIEQNLVDETKLDKNIKFILKKFDVFSCWNEHNDLYTLVLEQIKNLQDISVEDLKFVVEISTETIKQSKLFQSLKNLSSTNIQILASDSSDSGDSGNTYDSADVSEDDSESSMYWNMDEPEDSEAVSFVDLED